MKKILCFFIFAIAACAQQIDPKPAIAEAGLNDAFNQVGSHSGMANFRQVIVNTNDTKSFSHYMLSEFYLDKNKFYFLQAYVGDGISDYGQGVIALTNELLQKIAVTADLKELVSGVDYTTNFIFYDNQGGTNTNGSSPLTDYRLYKLSNTDSKIWISPRANGNGIWVGLSNPTYINGDTYYIKTEDTNLVFIKVTISKDKSVAFTDDPLSPYYLKAVYFKK